MKRATPKKTTTKTSRKRTAPKVVEVKAWPNWQPVGGSSYASGPDMYGRMAPNANELVQAFSDTVYACATLIAAKIACSKIKLYCRTNPGQPRPKVATRPAGYKTLELIRQTKALVRGAMVEEVVEHPLIDLLCHGNAYHNYHELVQYTSAYVETVGNAYWLMNFDDYSIPTGVTLLAAQFVEPKRDENGNVVGWRFGNGHQAPVYPVERVIHFRGLNLADPYGLGMSPLQAAWSRVQIQWKELGFLDANLTNFGRPDAILAPQEPISPFEAERLAKDFIHRFRGQGAGGVFVADGPMQVTPISWPAKDFAELQLYQTIKQSLSNVYHIPPDFWETGTSSNRATREAALYSLAVDCIKPRVTSFVEKLNERLIPYFDDRLFFQAEEVVPEDKDFVLREMQFLATTGALTRNEFRERYGYEPVEWGEEPLLPPGSMPAAVVEEQAEPAPPPPPEPIDRSGQAPAIAALQQAVYAGQLPREAAIVNVQLTFGFSADQANALFPDIPPVKLTPSEGGDTDGTLGTDAPETPEQPQQPVKAKALEVPDVRQQGDYDCGAAATMAVCQFYGVGPATEEDYIVALGTTEQDGTQPAAIVNYLASVGLAAEARNDMTIDDLAEAGCPVICCIQDYEEKPQDIPEEASGHYVVVCGAEDDNVTLQDPSAGRLEMPTIDFLARWEDRDDQGEFVHYGIAVRPGQKKGTPTGGRNKAVRKKNPRPLVDALRGFFQRQKEQVLGHVKALDEASFKAGPGTGWLDLEHWNRVFSEEMLPTVLLYYEDSAKQTATRIGGSPNLWATVQPNLKEAVRQQVFAFADSTNQTTSLELGQAIEILKKEMAEGLEQGDYKNLLMARVQKVFERASIERAYLIGHTEANRAQHAAMEITAIESGMASGKRWILSDDACPLCKPLAGKVVALGQNFTQDESAGPYSNIPYPPRHPGCRCDLIEVVEGVNDQ